MLYVYRFKSFEWSRFWEMLLLLWCFQVKNRFITWSFILIKNALRIVLYSANSIATKYNKYITPKLSVYSDFYVRVFFEVNRGKVEC